LANSPLALFSGGQNFEWQQQQEWSICFFFLCSLGGRLVTALTAISVTGVSAGVLYFKASLWHPQKPKDPSPITHPGHNPIPSCSLAAGYISTRLSVFAVCAYVTWMFLRLGCLLA